MKKAQWIDRITERCRQAKTYQPYFEDVIETLAGIMEKRDETEKQFKASGGEAVLEHTNSHGSTNLVKNPYLIMLNDLNRDALAYWRDLGLTPSGYKKINDKIAKTKEKSFEDLLKNIGV